MTRLVTFVPGSFKPPTAAHWRMICHYAGFSDRVVVVVSSPKDAVRVSGPGGRAITPDQSKAVLDVFKRRYGLDNVEITVSDDPSPVKTVLKEISGLTGCVVVIGTSDKGGDSLRYDWIQDRFEDSPSVFVMKPSETAFKAVDDMSAGDVRSRPGDFGFYRTCLPDRLTEADLETIRRTLGYQ